MSRFLFLPAICVASFFLTANAVQVPSKLESCLPIPTLRQDIQQRTTAREQAQSVSHIKVEELTFNGDPGLPPDELKRIADSLTQRTYDDDWLEELRQRITDAWQHAGYFRVQIGEAHTVERPGTQAEKRFAVSLSVDSGLRHYLRAIDFRNNTELSSTDLRAGFPIADGDVFDTHELQRGIENLRRAYGAKGFINVSNVPSFEIDESAFVKVSIEVQEGKRYTVGELRILGVTPEATKSLLQESGLERGQAFNATLLEKFFERNKSLLPSDADPVEDVQRLLDDQRATVDITMDFRRCPNIAQH